MNPGWQVVDCSKLEGSIGYERGQLVIRRTNHPEVFVSLASIAVVLVGTKVGISGAAIAKLNDYDIAVLVCDWRNIPIAGLYPWNNHSRIAARHIAQCNISLPRKKRAWAEIVKAKILGQAHTLKCFEIAQWTILNTYAIKVKTGDETNCEALAARQYWQSLIQFPHSRRLPHTGNDPVNACFDYAYTILRGYGIRAVTSAGICPTLGIFHRERSNMFALVDDLIEPFRPAVDYYLLKHIDCWDITEKETKKILVDACNQSFLSSGETISTALNNFAQNFGLFVEGKKAKLTVPYWKVKTNARKR